MMTNNTIETCPVCGDPATESEPGMSYCVGCCLDWVTGDEDSRENAREGHEEEALVAGFTFGPSYDLGLEEGKDASNTDQAPILAVDVYRCMDPLPPGVDVPAYVAGYVTGWNQKARG